VEKYSKESILAIADFIVASEKSTQESDEASTGNFQIIEEKLNNLKRFFTPPEIDTILTNRSDIRDVLCNAGLMPCRT
jgi:hypothetical protein